MHVGIVAGHVSPAGRMTRITLSVLFRDLRRNCSCKLSLHDFQPVGDVLHALFAQWTRPEHQNDSGQSGDDGARNIERA
jgi:hypothetical protein